MRNWETIFGVVSFGDSRKRNWSGEFLRLAAPCDQKQWRESTTTTNQDSSNRDTQQKVKGHWTISLFLFPFKIKFRFCTKTWEKDFYILHAVNMVLNIWHNYRLNFQVRQWVGKIRKNMLVRKYLYIYKKIQTIFIPKFINSRRR